MQNKKSKSISSVARFRPMVLLERLEDRALFSVLQLPPNFASISHSGLHETQTSPAALLSTHAVNQVAAADSDLDGSGNYDNADVGTGTMVFAGSDANLTMTFDAGAVYTGSRSGATVDFNTSNNVYNYTGTISDGDNRITGTFTDRSDGETVSGVFTRALNIVVATANNQTTYHITADATGGHMPALDCTATLVGTDQSAATTVFQWTAEIKFDHTTDPHAQNDEDYTASLGSTTGGHLLFPSSDWKTIRGGTLIITASAEIDGAKETSAPVPNLKIVGDNPTLTEIRAALKSVPLQKIAHLESNFSQFTAAGLPIFSKDNLNGVGIMQVTPEKRFEDEWNWLTEVDDAIAIYNHDYTLAAIYVQSLTSSTQLAALLTAYNNTRKAEKLAPVTLKVPAFTAEQQTNDAIRGYNGWAGSDPIDPSLHLHEYRLETNSKGGLVLNVSGTVGTAIWQEVPASARPPGVGDPNYVQDVLAETP